MVKITIFLLVLLFSSCTDKNNLSISAEKGIIDLSDEIIESEDIIVLEGEWQFFWDKWVLPKQIEYLVELDSFQYVSVPKAWNNYKNIETGENFPSQGAATYRIKVKLPKNLRKGIAIKIPKIWTANKVFINQKLVYEAGKMTTHAKDAEDVFLGNLIMLEENNSELDIVVQVANPNFFIGGILENFEIGKYKILLQAKDVKQTWSGIWLGLLFFIAIYHFVLFGFRPKQKSTLYFGLLTLFLGVIHLIFADHYFYEYLHLHTKFNSRIQFRLYYGSYFLLFPTAILYLKSLYPKESKRFMFPVSASLAVLGVLLLCLPTYIFLGFIQPLQVIQMIIAIIFGLTILGTAMYRKRDETLWQSLGVAFWLLTGIHDGLNTVGISLTEYFDLIQFGFGAFILLQMGIIAKRFSRAFKRVEDLTINLEHKVTERTLEVNERNTELQQQSHVLEQKNQHITDSIRYAARIQQSILGDKDSLQNLFKNSFVLFKPRDIVSGDFYWFTEIVINENKHTIIVCSDCTGHGVPGAFMTVMGNDLLTEIVINKKITRPNEILKLLDEKIEATFRNQNTRDGMDMAIINYCHSTRTLDFAGAKNPLYLVEHGTIQEVKGSKHAIGGGKSKYHKRKTRKDKDFETSRFIIPTQTTLYMATDGFQDQFGKGKNKDTELLEVRKFMKKRFRELLLEVSKLPISEQETTLNQILEEWKQTEKQTDDILVMGIYIE
ncbi:PP2C family protein-serine/threonine phosphatase [Bernardetia litoralis]|uniref:PP2C family protein-serine/threonine phosphatase n=1 Tax=Bernardetia litoralis TaxID=999 RepID=UPI00031B70D3|nr:7TM diverse intracellular signaling domain-containing protein [Bernardetia litoralis]